MDRTEELATAIVELFEDLPDSKDIEIPCVDESEQAQRYDGGNTAKLYGTEYFELIAHVKALVASEAK